MHASDSSGTKKIMKNLTSNSAGAQGDEGVGLFATTTFDQCVSVCQPSLGAPIDVASRLKFNGLTSMELVQRRVTSTN